MVVEITKYYNTIKYLKPRQTIGRVWGKIKAQYGLFRLSVPPNNLHGNLKTKTNFLHHDPWNTREEIINGKFTFLNKIEKLGFPQIKWENKNQSKLWKYNLHYFNYLYLLNKDEQEKICRDWIHKNNNINSIAWHPYVTSLRIVNWCKTELNFPAFLRSLYSQSSFLYNNTEFYHPGNHYLENARALIFAGLYFNKQGSAKEWYNKGLQILLNESKDQINQDGGYFELSPMYHVLMLILFLDVFNILPFDDPYKNKLERYIKKMSNYFVSVAHPDGQIALFNDSTSEIAPETNKIINYVEKIISHTPQEKSTFKDTGHFIYRDSNIFFIIDGGPIGPNYLPAHSHADIFNYELSLKGIQFIVDSGVYEYKTGDMRNYNRSTRAHNTVCIDQTNQAECWESFRVARRFPPVNVSYKVKESSATFRGVFNGYSRLIGDNIKHIRYVTIDSKNQKIIVSDTITGNNRHLVESFVHLHPEVRSQAIGKNAFLLYRKNVQCVLRFSNGSVKTEESWYCPEFGKRIKNDTICIGGELNLPVNIDYTIQIVEN